MIELILVIVIFGIISMIGADIFAKIYDNYILARTMNNLQTKTELALEQIARRLQYRIKDSTIARMDTNMSDYRFLGDANDSYHILEWIGYDDASLKGAWDGAKNTPGWSGFIDLNDTANTWRGGISSPGSRFDIAENIIGALSNNGVTLQVGTSHPAIVMDGHVGDYLVSSYGWFPSTDTNYTLEVTCHLNDCVTYPTLLDFTDNTPKELYEHYKLAWSAYAIVPQCPVGVTDDCNLTLFYNYQPWEGERYTDGNASLLTEHVTTFKFMQTGDTVRLKLCIGENVYDNNISFCKEKVVF
jgi:type II secretory pathway pseudopilin PulG